VKGSAIVNAVSATRCKGGPQITWLVPDQWRAATVPGLAFEGAAGQIGIGFAVIQIAGSFRACPMR
jgi:hypothetical protein